MRLTLSKMRQGRLPESIGRCQADVPEIAAAINSAQQRLLYAKEARNEGWIGTWAHTVFNVQRTRPYITLPRQMVRFEKLAVCHRPIFVQNQFYEFLQFGNGYQPFFECTANRSRCPVLQTYDRGMFPTFIDLTPGHLVRVRPLDVLDTQGNKRVLISGTDAYDTPIMQLDGHFNTNGTYLVLAQPFTDTAMTLNSITGIQKDVTNGQVQFWDVDPATGAETLILTMEASEETAWYRRYFLNSLPLSCCPGTVNEAANPTVQIDGIVKLNVIPVRIDPDYLLLQNEEAIIAEAQAMRYATMDGMESKALARDAHKAAIGFLQGELAHYLGTDLPAISFKPFGSASLEKQGIGITL